MYALKMREGEPLLACTSISLVAARYSGSYLKACLNFRNSDRTPGSYLIPESTFKSKASTYDRSLQASTISVEPTDLFDRCSSLLSAPPGFDIE